MNYYPVIDKVKVVLDLINYTSKKELEHAKGTDTPDYLLRKILLLWKLNLTSKKLINWLMIPLVWII